MISPEWRLWIGIVGGFAGGFNCGWLFCFFQARRHRKEILKIIQEPEGKRIACENLPRSNEPDDDGFDAYRLAVAMEVMRTGRTSVGHVDDDGNLFIEPFGTDD
jgi:hypothetical protein